MYSILFLKFLQNKDLREAILSENVDHFVEASPYDRIWGIGYLEQDAEEHISNWGLNLLGKTLDRVKQNLKVLRTYGNI